MGGSSHVLVQISSGALERNFCVLRDVARRADAEGAAATELLAVIKADAYGHGAELTAEVLAKAGARWVGVTDVREGVAVRRALQRAGRTSRILVMCGLLSAEEAAACAEADLVPVVWTAEQVRLLADAGRPVTVHLEVDTGMSRQGARDGEELRRLLDGMRFAAGEVRIGGLLTHFASAEVVGSEQTAQQMARFEVAAGQVLESGLLGEEPWVHAGNTSTLDEGGLLPGLRALAGRMGARLLARTGLALYGHSLPLEGDGALSQLGGRLQPVARWTSRVLSVREIEAGEAVGYNGTFRTGRRTRVALVAAGYADGVRRELSSTTASPGGWVLVRGQRAPMLGRISMNLLTADVSEIGGVEAGDEAVLMGAAPAMTADDHARLAGTIPYEILCGMRGERRLRG